MLHLFEEEANHLITIENWALSVRMGGHSQGGISIYKILDKIDTR